MSPALSEVPDSPGRAPPFWRSQPLNLCSPVWRHVSGVFHINVSCPRSQYGLTGLANVHDVFNRMQDRLDQAGEALQCVGLLAAIAVPIVSRFHALDGMT
jgi:hypothetical protein